MGKSGSGRGGEMKRDYDKYIGNIAITLLLEVWLLKWFCNPDSQLPRRIAGRLARDGCTFRRRACIHRPCLCRMVSTSSAATSPLAISLPPRSTPVASLLTSSRLDAPTGLSGSGIAKWKTEAEKRSNSPLSNGLNGNCSPKPKEGAFYFAMLHTRCWGDIVWTRVLISSMLSLLFSVPLTFLDIRLPWVALTLESSQSPTGMDPIRVWTTMIACRWVRILGWFSWLIQSTTVEFSLDNLNCFFASEYQDGKL